MRANYCIFDSITHQESGENLDVGWLDRGVYIETLELDGPKLLLDFRDPQKFIQNTLQIRETDSINVALHDTWREAGESFTENFVVLAYRPQGDAVYMELMASTVYNMKKLADKTRIFTGRSPAEIIAAFAGGAEVETGKFPVVESYHSIEGKRPSLTLRQMADEQGAHIWYNRGRVNMRRFAELYARAPVMTLTHSSLKADNGIISYARPSGQIAAQERSARKFTGWSETDGRVRTSADMPILSAVKSAPAFQTASPNAFVLGNAPIAKKPAIDLTAFGNLSLRAGESLQLDWLTPDPANPVNEGLPARVVADVVSHWYSAQKYYTRVQGAVAFAPI